MGLARAPNAASHGNASRRESAVRRRHPKASSKRSLRSQFGTDNLIDDTSLPFGVLRQRAARPTESRAVLAPSDIDQIHWCQRASRSSRGPRSHSNDIRRSSCHPDQSVPARLFEGRDRRMRSRLSNLAMASCRINFDLPFRSSTKSHPDPGSIPSRRRISMGIVTWPFARDAHGNTSNWYYISQLSEHVKNIHPAKALRIAAPCR